VPKQQKG